MKNRNAILIPKHLSIHIDTDKSSISAKYHIATDSHEIGSIYINFKPSDELVALLEKEIDEAVSKINQKDKPENFVWPD